ncbi:PAS domain S-box-containing protein [Roseateles sp. YR242]|uniref:CHASE domain-containing protein n=1 Tax=Roseateles sp. YR242 TaxID=1855305 RepID=UPI0008D21D7E|nr:CHASE domain-containing protein [Roseateles sp. YR242]SEK58371.1 PAS domain S-box-containing protein [Roseateles sp. YR242]
MFPAAVPYRRWLSTLGLNILIGGLYAALGVASLQLVLPPDYAAPVYPAAGLAVAAVLRWGPRLLPSIAIGCALVSLLLSEARGQVWLLAHVLVGLGAALQAYVGAALSRRWVGPVPRLTEPRELLRFYAAVVGIACLISPTVGSLTLAWSGALPAARWPLQWFSWWAGDAIGVMLATPVALSIFGLPRAHWAPRRLGVAVPMLLACVLLSAASYYISLNEESRRRHAFELEAEGALDVLGEALQRPLTALEANHSLLMVAPHISREDFERAHAERTPGSEGVYALGWSVRVAPSERAAFERAAQADGYPDYHLRERQRPGDLPPDPTADLMAIRLIVPFSRNQNALGINTRSIPQARVAQDLTMATGRPYAAEGFPLSQDVGTRAIGVVIYRAVYAEGDRGAEPQPRVRGLAFATLRPEGLLQESMPTQSADLDFCLLDRTPGTRHVLLAGDDRCAALPASIPTRQRAITFAGRQWLVVVYAPAGLPALPGHIGLPFAVAGLVCTGLLGLLLLLVTGRATRVAELVEEGTQRLRESEERFRSIVEHAPVGVVFTDLSGRPQTLNPYYAQLLGYTEEELKQRTIMKITHPEDRAEDGRLGNALIRGDLERYSRIKRYISAEGRLITVRVWVSLLRDAQGEPYRLVGVVEDIGEQLRLEELERLHESAHAAHRAKNEFLSRMSHELRTPLNAMLGFSQLLEADRDPPISVRQRSWVQHVQQSGWHLLEMINDALDMSRLEADQIRVELSPQALAPILADSLAMVETQRQRRQVTVHLELVEPLPAVMTDATRLRQILTNLLSNAIKYNREDGEVWLRAHRTADGAVQLSVTDTGAGLSEAQLTQLFQPFNRLGREAGSIEGTGLGLVITKRLVERLGSELAVASAPGRGSSFSFELQAAPAAALPPESTGPHPPEAAPAAVTDQQAQVLPEAPETDLPSPGSRSR